MTGTENNNVYNADAHKESKHTGKTSAEGSVKVNRKFKHEINIPVSERMYEYFDNLLTQLDEAFGVARRARARGLDPEPYIEIKLAPDMATRVEGLVGPKGIADDIRNLLLTGISREEVAARIVKKIINDRLPGDNKLLQASKEDVEKVLEQAIKTGVAIITDGVLVAPTEGISGVKIKENPDGTQYLAVYYAGPIRSAGGTAAAVSALLADIARKEVGLNEYRPTDRELKRYVEEINLYDARCARLQYMPSEKEILHIIKNCPVCITGDPTHHVEVSTYRDVPSVETNYVRGGMALVVGEGIAQKSAKLFKISKNIGNHWSWLEAIMKVKKSEDKKEFEIKPITSYMSEFVAGRPVFSYPMAKGGFRLRYGRTRLTGIMAKAFHPATLYLLYEFPAIGTQLKLERPGKACIVTTSEVLEPPVVRLKNGDVLRVEDVETAKKLVKEGLVDKILFLGDILSPIGDFLKSAHPIIPSSYVEEWWILECERAGALSDQVVSWCSKAPLKNIPGGYDAVRISVKFDVPLHPRYTYPWTDISPHELARLRRWLFTGSLRGGTDREGSGRKVKEDGLHLKLSDHAHEKIVLEKLYIPHRVVDDEIIIPFDYAFPLLIVLNIKPVIRDWLRTFGRGEDHEELDELYEWLDDWLRHSEERDPNQQTQDPDTEPSITDTPEPVSLDPEADTRYYPETLEIVNGYSPITVKNKVAVYIGSRMGRPEKAKERKMKPPVHVLFPIGMKQKFRDMISLYEAGKRDRRNRFVEVEIVRRVCKECGRLTVYPRCEVCGGETYIERKCINGHVQPQDHLRGTKKNGRSNSTGSGPAGTDDNSVCVTCGAPTRAYDKRNIDLVHYLDMARKRVGELPPVLKGPKGLMNKECIPELLEKGILRAKHNIYVFKDGTCRFDFINATITHFKPKEIGVSVDRLKQLGYTHDYLGNPLVDEDQIVELFPQDAIISDAGAEYLYRVGKFIDDLLVYVYKLPPYYKFKRKEDIIGHLAITQSPHTSAGVLTRIIGISKTRVGWYHPYLINATRRNCDGDENAVFLLLDALINFSKHYIPSTRGGTMDTPIVLTTIINPLEIDDEVYVMETIDKIPLEFYEESERFGEPTKYISLVKHKLNKEHQFEGFGFTHDVDRLDNGPKSTMYVRIENMLDKMDKQFELNKIIRAVDTRDAVRRVIVSHFLPDMYGNLRTFSRQTFRCAQCNTKYRRVPLKGVCTKCGGKLLLTVSKGSIEKYLNVSLRLADEYDLPDYLKQRLLLIKKEMENIFEDEKKKQVSLFEFM